MSRPVVVFDVNETLLDLSGLDPAFNAVFGDTSVRSTWFRTLLQLSLIANEVNVYEDFGVLGCRALRTVGASHGRALREDDVEAIMRVIPTLEPYPDVAPGLGRLRAAGFRTATLTNSPPATVNAQIDGAGLRDRFDAVLSVDAVRRFKPSREPYAYAAQTLGVAIGEIILVAAHGWDVYGAMQAGARAAFVGRAGQGLIADVPVPEIVAPTVEAVAEALIARDESV